MEEAKKPTIIKFKLKHNAESTNENENKTTSENQLKETSLLEAPPTTQSATNTETTSKSKSPRSTKKRSKPKATSSTPQLIQKSSDSNINSQQSLSEGKVSTPKRKREVPAGGVSYALEEERKDIISKIKASIAYKRVNSWQQKELITVNEFGGKLVLPKYWVSPVKRRSVQHQ